MEGFSALSPMPLSGGARRKTRRSASMPRMRMSLPRMAMGGRRHSHVRKVSAKTIRRTLRTLGMKPKGRVVLRGGEHGPAAPPAAPPAAAAPPAGASMTAGRRRRHGGRRRSLGVKNPLKALGF